VPQIALNKPAGDPEKKAGNDERGDRNGVRIMQPLAEENLR
jgi:hypothetical protein